VQKRQLIRWDGSRRKGYQQQRVVGITVVAVGERATNVERITDSEEVVVGTRADAAERTEDRLDIVVGEDATNAEVISVPKVVIKKLKVISSPLIYYGWGCVDGEP